MACSSPAAIACSRRCSSASSSSGSREPERTYSRRLRSRSRGGRWSWRATRVPLAATSSPPSIDVSPDSIRSSVVLPAPLRPAIVMRSRRSSLNDTPRSSGSPLISLARSEAISTATCSQATVKNMSPRIPLLAALAAALAVAAPASAKYVSLPGAPGYGPAKYAKVFVEKTGPASAKNVLVLIPGTFGGSGDFGIVADALVAKIPNLQVWAIDRRGNALEDTSYMVKGLKGEITGQQLFDYYIGWFGTKDITTHSQPVPDSQVQYARKWGLKLAMEDTRRVILAAKK